MQDARSGRFTLFISSQENMVKSKGIGKGCRVKWITKVYNKLDIDYQSLDGIPQYFRWNTTVLQMEYHSTLDGTPKFRWNAKVQMERQSSDGTPKFRWNTKVQMEHQSSDGTPKFR